MSVGRRSTYVNCRADHEMEAGKEPDTSAGQPPETTPDIIDKRIDKNTNKAITAP